MKTFLHHGDIGDIIYSLPILKQYPRSILYLDIEGGRNDPLVSPLLFRGKLKFNKQAFDFIKPLLLAQSYIEDVLPWSQETVDLNLSLFRKSFDCNKNLVYNHLDYFKIPREVSNPAWLQASIINDYDATGYSVYCRTLRYQANYPKYLMILHKDKNKKLFVGTKFEHEVFEKTFDIKIEHKITENALQVASLIKSCNNFITNQGANHAIAVALAKENVILEIQKEERVCFFENRKIIYV